MTSTSISCKKFTLYCCNKVFSQIIFTTNVEFFLPFFNCSQLFPTFLFYKEISCETRKILNTKSNDNKTFLFEFSRRLKIKCLYQQIIYSSAHQKCTWIISLFLKLSKNRCSDLEVFSILPQGLLEAAFENSSFWCYKWKHKQVFTFSNLFINTNVGNSHHLRYYSWK